MLIKKIIFFIIYGIFIYITLCFFVVLLSFIGIQQNFIISNEPFLSNQIYLYHKGLRNIWQNNANCVDFVDSELKYVPKIGSCEFNNPEFKTRLNFTKNGRDQKNDNKSKNLIAFIGDSVTMGWGVNDHETFSNLVESNTNYKTYNLGVSSYGTYRELIRLKQNENFNKIEKVFIQYHRNDLDENQHYFSQDESNNNGKEMLNNKIRNFNEKQFILKAIKNSISKNHKYIFQKEKEKKPIDFIEHQYYLEKIINNFDLKNKEVYIFYVNDFNRKFTNFPNKKVNNITYFSIELEKNDFYKIDDHPNANGHNKIANQIIELINR